jgi:hypothetical protein
MQSFQSEIVKLIVELKLHVPTYNTNVLRHYAQLDRPVPPDFTLMTNFFDTCIEDILIKFEYLFEFHYGYSFYDGDEQAIYSLMLFCQGKFRDHVLFEIGRRFADDEPADDWDPEPRFKQLIDTMDSVTKAAFDIMDDLSNRIRSRALHGRNAIPSLVVPRDFDCDYPFEKEYASLVHMLELCTFTLDGFLSISRRWNQPLEYRHYNLQRTLINTTNVLMNRIGRSSYYYDTPFQMGDNISASAVAHHLSPVTYEIFNELRTLRYDELGPNSSVHCKQITTVVQCIEQDFLGVATDLEDRISSWIDLDTYLQIIGQMSVIVFWYLQENPRYILRRR